MLTSSGVPFKFLSKQHNFKPTHVNKEEKTAH